jgi:hypothetical protein
MSSRQLIVKLQCLHSAALALGICALFWACAQAQPQHSGIDLSWKIRDNNRWEGVTVSWPQPMSSMINLVSMIVWEDRSSPKSDSIPDPLTVFFYLSDTKRIELSVTQREKRYKMQPIIAQFTKTGWQEFTWPGTILKELDLTLHLMHGFLLAKNKIPYRYSPIFFFPPNKLQSPVLLLHLVAENNMTIDAYLYREGALDRPICAKKDVVLYAQVPEPIQWPLNQDNLTDGKYNLVLRGPHHVNTTFPLDIRLNRN